MRVIQVANVRWFNATWVRPVPRPPAARGRARGTGADPAGHGNRSHGPRLGPARGRTAAQFRQPRDPGPAGRGPAPRGARIPARRRELPPGRIVLAVGRHARGRGALPPRAHARRPAPAAQQYAQPLAAQPLRRRRSGHQLGDARPLPRRVRHRAGPAAPDPRRGGPRTLRLRPRRPRPGARPVRLRGRRFRGRPAGPLRRGQGPARTHRSRGPGPARPGGRAPAAHARRVRHGHNPGRSPGLDRRRRAGRHHGHHRPTARRGRHDFGHGPGRRGLQMVGNHRPRGPGDHVLPAPAGGHHRGRHARPAGPRGAVSARRRARHGPGHRPRRHGHGPPRGPGRRPGAETIAGLSGRISWPGPWPSTPEAAHEPRGPHAAQALHLRWGGGLRPPPGRGPGRRRAGSGLPVRPSGNARPARGARGGPGPPPLGRPPRSPGSPLRPSAPAGAAATP